MATLNEKQAELFTDRNWGVIATIREAGRRDDHGPRGRRLGSLNADRRSFDHADHDLAAARSSAGSAPYCESERGDRTRRLMRLARLSDGGLLLQFASATSRCVCSRSTPRNARQRSFRSARPALDHPVFPRLRSRIPLNSNVEAITCFHSAPRFGTIRNSMPASACRASRSPSSTTSIGSTGSGETQ
jgi:hypothetical protein